MLHWLKKILTLKYFTLAKSGHPAAVALVAVAWALVRLTCSVHSTRPGFAGFAATYEK